MSFEVSFKMSSKYKNLRFFTEKDLNFERIFEVRIVDIRGRGGMKQKSFSILAERGLNDNEYPSLEELKIFLETKIKEIHKLG